MPASVSMMMMTRTNASLNLFFFSFTRFCGTIRTTVTQRLPVEHRFFGERHRRELRQPEWDFEGKVVAGDIEVVN